MKTVNVLVYHGKHGDEYWLVDTPERLQTAMRQLFQMLDEWHCYENSEEGVAAARAGDAKAIKWILMRHAGYEYEGWDIIEATDPCTP